jgi:hypothetical protein
MREISPALLFKAILTLPSLVLRQKISAIPSPLKSLFTASILTPEEEPLELEEELEDELEEELEEELLELLLDDELLLELDALLEVDEELLELDEVSASHWPRLFQACCQAQPVPGS